MSLPNWNTEKVLEVQKSGRRALIKFWAPWCGPCKAIAPLVEEVSSKHADVEFGQVNLDEEPEVGRLFGIRGLPTIVAVEKGGVAWTQVGLVSGPALDARLAKWA